MSEAPEVPMVPVTSHLDAVPKNIAELGSTATGPAPTPERLSRLSEAVAGANSTEQVQARLGLEIPTHRDFAKVQALTEYRARSMRAKRDFEKRNTEMPAPSRPGGKVAPDVRGKLNVHVTKETDKLLTFELALSTILRRFEPEEFRGLDLDKRIQLFGILWGHVTSTPLEQLQARAAATQAVKSVVVSE